MADDSLTREAARGVTVTTRWRFNPHLLVLLVGLWIASVPIREAVWAWTFVLNDYQQLDFVIAELDPNDGWPYVRGTLEPSGEEWVMEVATAGSRQVVAGDAAVIAAPGERVRVWWSEDAPVIGMGLGRSTKIMPVAALPQPPGAIVAVGWSVLGLLGVVAAVLAMVRTYRWAVDSVRTH